MLSEPCGGTIISILFLNLMRFAITNDSDGFFVNFSLILYWLFVKNYLFFHFFVHFKSTYLCPDH